MTNKDFSRNRLACAWFFIAPALIYGIFTSRLPAIKLALGINDAQTAILLFALGGATLCGLLGSAFIIDKTGPKKILVFSTIFLCASIALACLCPNFPAVIFFCVLTGLGVGLCDVAGNALGIIIEQRYNAGCLSFLHAFSGIGGVTGALSGSFFAGLQFSPFLNMIIMLAIFFLFMPLVLRALQEPDTRNETQRESASWRSIALIVYLFGFLNLVLHICEGSVGEWGSILLHSVKGASQQEAALAFAPFTAALVICRLFADNLRRRIKDAQLAFYGCLLGAVGMAIVLLSPWPWLCLCGYGVMGAGLAPVAPILFSRAGAVPGVTPGQASTIVSVFSYSGLLLFPPFLGTIGHAWGLTNALWLVFALCCLLAVASIAIHGKNDRESTPMS